MLTFRARATSTCCDVAHMSLSICTGFIRQLYRYRSEYANRLLTGYAEARRKVSIDYGRTHMADIMRILELQIKADAKLITVAEQTELDRLELEWHNAALTDSHDIPVRA